MLIVADVVAERVWLAVGIGVSVVLYDLEAVGDADIEKVEERLCEGDSVVLDEIEILTEEDGVKDAVDVALDVDERLIVAEVVGAVESVALDDVDFGVDIVLDSDIVSLREIDGVVLGDGEWVLEAVPLRDIEIVALRETEGLTEEEVVVDSEDEDE